MTTQISRTAQDLSVFFPRRFKERNLERDNNATGTVYLKELQFAYFWDNRNTVDEFKMTPEELDFLKKLSEDVLELKAMFQRFTSDKKQRWEEKSRQGVGRGTSE